MVINLNHSEKPTSKKLINLILHEGFHTFIQTEERNWLKNQTKQFRGDIYPLQSIPRYFRLEMYQSLVDYLDSKEVSHLHNYSYWFWKWKVTFPKEYNNYTDRIEGSAEYYTNEQLTRIQNLKHTQKTTSFKYYKNSKKFLDLKESLSLTVESYHLGALAGIVLDEKLKHWKKEVRKGASPLELLALLQTKRREEPNFKLQNELIKISVKKMEQIDNDGRLDESIKLLANRKVLMLIIPMSEVDSSGFTSSGMYQSFFNFRLISNVQLIKLLTPVDMQHENWKTQIPSENIWIMAKDHPCADESLATVIPLKKGSFRYKKGKLQVLEPYNFSLDVKPFDDRRIFCGKF